MPEINRIRAVLSANRLPVEIMQMILEENTSPSMIARFATCFPIVFCSIVSFPRLARVFLRCSAVEARQEMVQIVKMKEEAIGALRIFIKFKGIPDLMKISRYAVKLIRFDIMEVLGEYCRKYEESPVLCE
jgi:hypothetical protein